jgi:hypothetical protein
MTLDLNPGISEAASEKKRRGRPRIPGFEVYDGIRSLYHEVKTNHGYHNKLYEQEATMALGLLPSMGGPPEGYEHLQWLADWKGADRNKRGTIKSSILTELGRLLRVAEFDTVLYVADIICKEKPSTKNAIARIRRVRLQRSTPPDKDELFSRLANCVNQYLIEHSEISNADVLAAITQLYSGACKTGGGGAP